MEPGRGHRPGLLRPPRPRRCSLNDYYLADPTCPNHPDEAVDNLVGCEHCQGPR